MDVPGTRVNHKIAHSKSPKRTSNFSNFPKFATSPNSFPKNCLSTNDPTHSGVPTPPTRMTKIQGLDIVIKTNTCTINGTTVGILDLSGKAIPEEFSEYMLTPTNTANHIKTPLRHANTVLLAECPEKCQKLFKQLFGFKTKFVHALNKNFAPINKSKFDESLTTAGYNVDQFTKEIGQKIDRLTHSKALETKVLTQAAYNMLFCANASQSQYFSHWVNYMYHRKTPNAIPALWITIFEWMTRNQFISTEFGLQKYVMTHIPTMIKYFLELPIQIC